MTTKSSKKTNKKNVAQHSDILNETLRKAEGIQDVERFGEQLSQLVPKENPEASQKIIAFLVQHKHEFPSLDAEMASQLRADRDNKKALVDSVAKSLTRYVQGYVSRENWKVIIVGLYTSAAIAAGGWLIYLEQFYLGTSLIASPFIVTLLGNMFKNR